MGQALYRKYRSKNFDEIIGQNHIVAVLKNSLKNSNLSHAYLLTGPRGTGKTSVARIIAQEVNGLIEGDDQFYPDIIEIDAASNRRIEEVRELRDKIATMPSQLKYKVYIVDEVHMLTREAFNALLKTLEEPPAHAIFILATTDFHKVPDTIVSRCMRLNFKMISSKDLVAGMKSIAKKETIDIDGEALILIAQHSGGSFRDALSLMDQLSSSGQAIDTELVELSLGIASEQSIEKLIGLISSNSAGGILEQIQQMVDSGATSEQINKQLSGELRKSLISSESSQISNNKAIQLIENLNATQAYQDQKIALELAILKVITPDNQPLSQPAETSQPEVVPPQPDRLPSPPQSPKSDLKADKLWQEVLDRLKEQNNTLYSVARMAEPTLQNNSLHLSFKFPFHLKQVGLDKNKNLIAKILNELNSDCQLIITKSDNPKAAPEVAEKQTQNKSPDDLKSISNIFGSAEVLES